MTALAPPQISVIVPTCDRRQTLLRTLEAIAGDAAGLPVEIVVADDASSDRSAEAAQQLAEQLDLPLHCVRRERRGGPGAARNSAVTLARAPVLLFLGDDMPPRPGLLRRHLYFHRRRSGRGEAMLGLIVPSAGSDSAFARWLHAHGKQFAFARMSAGSPVPASLFYAANLSLKTSLLHTAGGFDERFGFGHEERELGRRLEAEGVRISHDPEAVAEHDHPTDLNATLRRMREFGRAHRLLTELDSSEPAPRPPGARHRAAAAGLTIPALLGLRAEPVRERTWRFLCEQASREAFWGEDDPGDPAIRVGRGVARRAARDPATRPAEAPIGPLRA